VELSTPQRNAIFRSIDDAGLDARDFEWIDDGSAKGAALGHRLAVRYTGEPFRTRDRPRFNAWIEVDSWHGWAGPEPWPVDA
jgi:hypothetical protein